MTGLQPSLDRNQGTAFPKYEEEEKKSSKQAKQFLPKILTLHFKAALNSFPCVPCVVHH